MQAKGAATFNSSVQQIPGHPQVQEQIYHVLEEGEGAMEIDGKVTIVRGTT